MCLHAKLRKTNTDNDDEDDVDDDEYNRIGKLLLRFKHFNFSI